MKRIILFLMLMPFLAIGQKTVTELGIQNNSQILLKGPSQLRTFKMFDSLRLSSVNLLGSYSNPSWITSLANTKITGLGALATITPGTGVASALGVNVGSAGAVTINTNSAIALTDASTIDIANSNNTLTTSSATRTFTISYTGDDIILLVTLNTTTSALTFPSGSLVVNEGVSGTNVFNIVGTSGDKYLITSKKIGSVYFIVCKNFGQ